MEDTEEVTEGVTEGVTEEATEVDMAVVTADHKFT